MNKHTSGPWSQDKYGNVMDRDGNAVLVQGVALAGRSTSETRANAILIAAAPELLEALQTLLDLDEELSSDGAHEAIAQARAAIAKATGGAA